MLSKIPHHHPSHVCVWLYFQAPSNLLRNARPRGSVCVYFFSRVIHVTATAVIRIRMEQCVIRIRWEGVEVIDLIKEKVICPRLFYSKYCILYGSKIRKGPREGLLKQETLKNFINILLGTVRHDFWFQVIFTLWFFSTARS